MIETSLIIGVKARPKYSYKPNNYGTFEALNLSL